jgi:hypothetical protein
VAQDLQRKGYVGRTIGIKLRYDDFRAVTRDQTIAEPTQDAATIRRVAGLCLKRVPLDGVCACWGCAWHPWCRWRRTAPTACRRGGSNVPPWVFSDNQGYRKFLCQQTGAQWFAQFQCGTFRQDLSMRVNLPVTNNEYDFPADELLMSTTDTRC